MNDKPGSGRGRGIVRAGAPWRPRSWRLRTKVIVMLLVPMVTAIAFGGLRVLNDLDRADQFQQTVSQVDLARDVTSLVHELQKERMYAVAWAASGRQEEDRARLDGQSVLVDQGIDRVTTTADRLELDDEAAMQRYAIGLQRLTAIRSVRAVLTESAYPDVAVYNTYTHILDALVQLGRGLNTAVTDRELLRQGTVIQAVSEIKEYTSRENAILQAAGVSSRDRFPGDMESQALAAKGGADAALIVFRANASTEETQIYSDLVSGAEVDNRERIVSTALANGEDGVPLGFTPALLRELTRDGQATVDHMREVEARLLDNLRSDAQSQADAAFASAWRYAGIVVAALIVALALVLVATRSLLKPLRVLRRDALDVANRRLPLTVERILADPDPAAAAKNAVEPVPVFTNEETGQLARSFDQMQEQAVRMATEQALLRDNINSIFVNLSRRSQRLVERQLSLIDRLEQDEQDPDQLASLFELDHLATRMRRNSESLLVLSGSGLSRQLNRPVPASEVVGAAISEVEHYARIELVSAPEVTVQGRAVSDLVHLIAELLDNATFFSEPEKKVVVRMAVTRRKELAIQITDSGVGMSEEEIAAANERLADPPDLDVAVTRRMGLYVVARLAKRHNINVRLRDNEDIEGGLIARINVPAELVAPAGATGRPGPPPPINETGSTPAAKASGIAGAFTGGVPRLRPESTTGETQVDRPPQEVAGYPAFTPSAEGSDPPLNGQYGEQAAIALFGNPMPEPTESNEPPGLAVADEARTEVVGQDGPAGGTAFLPAAQPPTREEVDHNVDAPTERLPIYEAVLSQWFEAADTGSQPTATDERGAEPATNGTDTSAIAHTDQSTWVSPGDEGWQAARALLDNSAESATTSAGLPKRVPKAHLVPGSAAPREPAEPADSQQPPPPLPPRSAEAVRGRMSSFQQGVRRGRHALIDAYAGDQSGSDQNRNDEEQE